MNFVIIGADAAGMSAASRAKRTQPEMNITVLEKTQDVSYSACGMPYNIADPQRSIEELVVRRAEVFREKQGIDLLTGHFVEGIRPEKQEVVGTTCDGESFSYPYDKLLIATGASPIKPDIPGIDLPGVMTLKSLEDGRAIKQYMKEMHVRRVVIVGMGYIALEMCEAFSGLNLQVSMLKPNPTLLPWLEKSSAQIVQEELESHGVELLFGNHVRAVEEYARGLKVVCDKTTLETDMLLFAMGVRPNSNIAENAGLELSVGDSIAVNKKLQTSDENIYSAGDCADAYHVVSKTKTWIPLALRANRAGWAAADNVCGIEKELPGIAGTAVFKVFDLEVARTGLNMQEASAAGFVPAGVAIKTRSKAHAHPGNTTLYVHMVGDKKTGLLLGAQMVGREGVAHRINAPAVALNAQMTVEQFSESDLAYAPPFGPTWDPLLTAANQLLKGLRV
jgi:NADPH-dependent 2,4-dienoyl-CoA reductase/sulfur reductase-like enzyme